MLFRKDIEPRCEYCIHGQELGEEEIGCVKLGITSTGESCAKFRYDPVKRKPERHTLIDASRFSREDFEL